MIYTYLDWNIFNKIEKKDTLDQEQCETFSIIEKLILEKQIVTPYSNAHINDLLRGHAKEPSYIAEHLATLKRLSNNLCIVQYWGNQNTLWHYREVEEFFNSALEEKEANSKPFTKLLDWDGNGIWENYCELLKNVPLPSNFKEIFKKEPIFELLFPKTKMELNMLAFLEDIYDFSDNTKKDYSIYKSLRSFINQGFARLNNNQKILKEVKKLTSEVPTYLNLDDALEHYTSKTKTCDNPEYQKITETYFKIDFKGTKADEKFPNLIDDSIHVFYGAHCDYFITLDDKCHYKAAETYHKLSISTKAMKPKEFVQYLNALTS